MSENNIRQALVQRLESLHRAGITQLPKLPAVKPLQATTVPGRSEPVSVMPAREESPKESNVPPRKNVPFSKRAEALSVLQQEVATCTKCPELVAERTQTVFGVGNPRTRLCFFGEAPGADEDREGEPFVGRCGQLLTKIIEACTLSRKEIYILNTVKCRPPSNRNPSTDEVANCRPYFERQLEIIQPEFICCLGAVAAQTLLETTEAIGRLRGKFHDYRGAKVLATYHPAYLLRNPPAKRHVWDDMQILMREMGIELPEE